MKDTDRLVAAYDDAQGVTAEFNRNVLRVVNRELGADFAPEQFAHVARWDAEAEWIEMRLRAVGAQAVHVRAPRPRRPLRRRRGAPHRDQRQVPPLAGRRRARGRRARGRGLVDRPRRRLRPVARRPLTSPPVDLAARDERCRWYDRPGPRGRRAHFEGAR